MKRTQALLAALGVMLALSATGWAIGVNTGAFGDGQRHNPVSARVDATDTASPEVVETVYVDVPASSQPEAAAGADAPVTVSGGGGSASSEGSAPAEAPQPVSRPSHDDDDDHDDERESSSSRKSEKRQEPSHEDREEEHDDD